MAMFNFELGGQQEVKPMRSYVSIDESGKATAKIFADEYDQVKDHPDFQRFKIGSEANMNRQQTMDEMLAEEKMGVVQKRIDQLKREAVAADVAYSKSQAEGNLYTGPDLFGMSLGRKTFKEKAEAKRSELQKALEEEAALSGATRTGQEQEISAPMESVGAGATAQAPDQYVTLRAPDGSSQRIKKSLWTSASPKDPNKKVSEVYLQSGYSVIR